MRIFTVLVLSVFLFGACKTEPHNHSDLPTLEMEAKAVFLSYINHLEQARYDSAFAILADDKRFHWLENGKIRYLSRESMQRAFEQYKGYYRYQKFNIDTLLVDVIDPVTASVAVEYDHYYRLVTGDSLYQHGSMMTTLIHGKAGWKILHGHTSVERDPVPAIMKPPK